MVTFLKIDQRKNEAIHLYEKGFTMVYIAEKYKCNPETVRRRFAEWKVVIKPKNYWCKGVSKSPDHAQKLRANLDKQRGKASLAMKELWSTYDGKKVTRKEFLNLIREKAIEERRKIDNKGSKNPKWKGGVSFAYFKQTVFARDGRICADCGYNEHPEIMEVHHIDGNHVNNDINNGKVLCPNCHRIEEFSRKTFHTKNRIKRYA